MPIQKLTPEEIAKQFQLPERKSKLATLLKQDGQVYCICRSSDSSRFMIGCDLCDQWYHGDCIGISQKDSKNIKRYYCERCQEDDPTLKIVYKTPSKPLEPDIRREHQIRGRPKKDATAFDPIYIPPKKGKSSSKAPCGYCMNCRRTANCGNCHICKEIKKNGARRVKEKCINRICVKLKPSSSKRHEYDDSSSDGEQNRFLSSSIKPGMQCYGPGCVETALPNSKYCSDKCGMKLATNRIFNILPPRLQGWSLSPSYAESVNKRDLETVRRKQIEARAALHELDKRYQRLESIIAKGKELEPCFVEPDLKKTGFKKSNVRGRKENDKEEEASVYCVTCGHEIHTSSAIKHMEKCFSKYESQASFGSMYKTRIEGNNMFCDFYNAANKTYCKRLRVLCPEHTKDPIIGSNEACGCPLVKDVFEETSELCTYPKKFCFKHYCWEKLRRAEIDMERVRQWLKIDELFEQERQIRQKLVQRAGVLALLLHTTYEHDAVENMATAQENEDLERIGKTFCETYEKEPIKHTKENKKYFKPMKKL